VPRFGDVLFSGSRFIFWALTPLLILFIVISFLDSGFGFHAIPFLISLR